MERLVLLSFLLSFFVHACGAVAPTATETPTSAPETHANKPAWKRNCEEYAGAPVTIRYEDASGGAAVVYSTQGDVAALRQRTQEVANFHNSSEPKLGVLHDLYKIPHRASVENVEQGARLVLVPKRVGPQVIEALRVHVQQETFLMQRNGCHAGREAL